MSQPVGEPTSKEQKDMSIQKKSLISSLKNVKKANLAAGPVKKEGESVRKAFIATKKAARFSRVGS